jgi:hypothetical protein
MIQRASTRIPCRWKALFGERELSGSGVTHDISETGLYIQASTLPKVGTLLKLRLESPTAASALMMGQVVRISPGAHLDRGAGFGVKLISERALMRSLIMATGIDRLGPKPAPKPATLPAPRPVSSTPLIPVLGPLAIPTREAFQRARREEWVRGGLSFASPTPVGLNQDVVVGVVFGWNARRVPVHGRTVRCDSESGSYRVLVVLNDRAKTLDQLDAAARV